MSDTVRTHIEDGIAWVMIDNPPVNATSTSVRRGFLRAVEEAQGCDLAVLRCAGKTFIAGGDMSEFDAPPVEPHLPDVVAAIEESATPFVALLHGNVLGGGFEIAMACSFRVARPGTRFGLPEVNVGLVPGAGGSQRVPRLLGWEMAMQMACLGQMRSAEELYAVGAIDLIADDLNAAVPQFRSLEAQRVSEREIPTLEDAVEVAFREQIEKFAKGRSAPLHNLTALKWANEPYAEAQPKERALHLKLRKSDESKALRHVFFAERAVTRPVIMQGVTPLKLSKIAIVGGGLMGSGIASACLNAGYKVTIIERNNEVAEGARQTAIALMQGALDRGKITSAQFESQKAALTTSANINSAANADLALEAVFEDLGAKQKVFQSLAAVVRPDTLLATNTSYLDPDAIFDGISGQERCVGIHFFSPAHIMKLVEVIRARETSEETLATAFAFANRLRKTPVLAGICDGFIGNRILAAYRREAEYLLADGALPHEIDSAMRAFGMAMGPLEAQDQSGLQIAEANRRRQDATRDPSERYVTISDTLCAMGRLGKRTAAGWYAYPDGARSGEQDKIVEDVILSFSKEAGIARRHFNRNEIQMRLLTVMANEGARIVEEGIAESAAAVDVVKTAGYGFPRWRGGPMHWADSVSAAAVKATLTQLEIESPGSWVRAQRFCDE